VDRELFGPARRAFRYRVGERAEDIELERRPDRSRPRRVERVDVLTAGRARVEARGRCERSQLHVDRAPAGHGRHDRLEEQAVDLVACDVDAHLQAGVAASVDPGLESL